jgi:hypothetical protein
VFCRDAEQLLDTLKTYNYHDTLAVISYNSSYTDSSFINMRKVYYGNFADPQLFLEGDKILVNDSSTYANSINTARMVTPSLNLYLDARATASEGTVILRIVNVDSLLELDSVFAFVAVCQDSAHGNLKDFNYVCRDLKYYPVTAAYADSTEDTLTFTFTSPYPIAKLHAVAFIQDLNHGSTQFLTVYQAVTVPFISAQPYYKEKK